MKFKGIAYPLIVILFFMWGFITVLNDLLIPHWKEEFQLSNLSSMLVNFAFFIAYFIGSLAYYIWSSKFGDPINKIGYKKGIIIGLITCAIGSFTFIPASFIHVFPLYLVGLFIIGLGFTLLQITCNPYVSILGSPEGASSRLNFAQGINSLGTTLSPIIGGFLIFQYFDVGDEIKMTYFIFGVIFSILALLIAIIDLPEFKNEDEKVKGLGALTLPQVRWGMIAIFCYVGAEVTVGSKIVELLQLDSFGNIDSATAKNYVSIYWGGAMMGRFMGFYAFNESFSVIQKVRSMLMVGLIIIALLAGIQITQSYLFNDPGALSIKQILPMIALVPIHILATYLGNFLPQKSIATFACVNIFLLVIGVVLAQNIGMWAVIGVGVFNSILWSNIFTASIKGLGKYTSQASSFLVMMILGGAIIPLLYGFIADILTPYTTDAIKIAYLTPIICYTYLIFFGLKKFTALTQNNNT